MGEVYRARDLKLQRDVAVKVLRPDVAGGVEQVRRFEQEAHAASALNHPNIVTIYDIGQVRKLRFIVMELVEGRTLREVVQASLDLKTVLGWIRQAAEALAVAHQGGIVHRDVKPENIMVREDGYVKLLDFGLARLVGGISVASGQKTNERTLPGTLVGTARYMSPEQVRAEPVSSATDIFSLGTILYELSTGHHPFHAEHLIGVLNAIIGRTPPLPTRLRPSLPRAFEELVLQLLQKDPTLRPTASEVEAELSRLLKLGLSTSVPGPAPRDKRHTVGREDALTALRDSLEVVTVGRGLLVSISGEAGMGKSTLVETFLDEIAGPGRSASIGRGRCSERLAGTEAYLPFLEALESLLQGDDRDSISGVLKAVAPTWHREMRPSGSIGGVPAVSQERLKREVGSFLQELSVLRPVVLLFDDIHWADVSTVDLLGYLAARFESMRTLVLVTYRPGELQLAKHPFLQVKLDLQARRLGREIQLDFLTRSDIQDYLSLQFPRNRFLAEFSQVLHSRTEGNPLFVVDLIRDLKEQGVIAQEGGVWTLERAVPEIEMALPKSIQSMIELKLGGLSDQDRRLLVTASVQGHQFDSATVARAVQMDAAEVEERLQVLERIHAFVQLLSEQELPNGTLTLGYRFLHSVYQNALYRLLTPTRRAATSRAVADALLFFHGDNNPSVASHVGFLLEAARDFERGSDFFLLAARHAARILGYRERVDLAERGLKLLRAVPESPARTAKELALLVTLGPAMMVTKGWAAEEVETTYARARDLAEKTNHEETLFHALWGLFSVRLVRAEFEPALELCKDLLHVAEPGQDPSLLLQAHLAFGETFFYLGELSKAKKHLDESRSLEPRAANSSRRLSRWQDMGSRTYSAWVLCLLGYPDSALETSRAAIALVQEKKLSHPFSLAYAYWSAIALHQFRREPAETETWSRKAVELCHEYELATFWSWGVVVLGWSLVKQGRRKEGIQQMRQGLDAFRNTGAELASTYFMGLLAEAYRDDGQVTQGLVTVDDALAAASELGERFFEAELLRLRGELLLVRDADDRTAVEHCFRRAAEIARHQGAKWLELRAAVSLSRFLMEDGKQTEAHRGLSTVYESLTEGAHTEDVQQARKLLEALS